MWPVASTASGMMGLWAQAGHTLGTLDLSKPVSLNLKNTIQLLRELRKYRSLDLTPRDLV